MVLLLMQIVLTVVAWRKGWRAKALLPVLIAWLMAFLMGAGFGATGGASPAQLSVVGFMCDLGAVVALVFMSRRVPQAKVSTVAAPKWMTNGDSPDMARMGGRAIPAESATEVQVAEVHSIQ